MVWGVCGGVELKGCAAAVCKYVIAVAFVELGGYMQSWMWMYTNHQPGQHLLPRVLVRGDDARQHEALQGVLLLQRDEVGVLMFSLV